jgi:hypothetical protein
MIDAGKAIKLSRAPKVAPKDIPRSAAAPIVAPISIPMDKTGYFLTVHTRDEGNKKENADSVLGYCDTFL